MINWDSALGVEVRGADLFLATVKKGLQDYVLKNYSRIENFQSLAAGELRSRILQYVRSNGFNRENVILGIPREQVIVRTLQLPLEVEENLDRVVRFQMEKFEPSEEEGSYYDYVLIHRDMEQKKLLLQIYMVPKKILDSTLQILAAAQLLPAAVRISSAGLYQLFTIHEDGFPQKNGNLLIKIEPGSAEFVWFNSTRFVSDSAILEESPSLECLWKALDQFLSRLAATDEGVSKIYLAGSLGKQFLPEFRTRYGSCELMEEKLSIKGKTPAQFPVFANSVGLAVSALVRNPATRFNLIPTEKRVVGERPSLIPTALLTLLVILMGIAVGTREHLQRRQVIEGLDRQIASIKPQVDQVMELRQRIERTQAQIAELQELMKGRQRVLSVLKELTEKIPESAFLQNVNIAGDKVNITGYADSASTLLPVLLNSKYLKSVESRYITPDRSMGNKEKFNFEATIRD
ncbi:MAG: PilN domain-containing protein [Acidobacteria bacterium]|nr:PilN domain-containing protein [Acidobacteriota bacterium]